MKDIIEILEIIFNQIGDDREEAKRIVKDFCDKDN